ncbi:MAG TPA: DUF2442 domain-containing protein [Spirochaetia bacterium]|nr:DUF2442 domain-containing protein [Spirochaetia bacterium]
MVSYTLDENQLWHRVQKALPLNDHVILLEFDKSDYRIIDMKIFFSFPVFQTIATNRELFKQVFVSGRTIEWPDGATLDPDVLYHESIPLVQCIKPELIGA